MNNSQFQFHVGAIKREWLETIKAEAQEFQFHVGAIKGYASGYNAISVNNFNSMLVRLKDAGVINDAVSSPYFSATVS
ncbi:hypothetical protein ABDK00_001260 [Niabella insulamsoli]|uniref:hypothetical protein n=1 Tax=Niabella insulamsoli TaxID=3144874 RepID=UPI0031FD395E